MHCIKCGAEIAEDGNFCTGCGEKVITKKIDEKKKFWSRKKSIWLIIASIITTSLFWNFLLGTTILSTEDESVNIITHLIETIGRQSQAWEKTEQIIELVVYGISDECIYQPVCVDETVDAVTTLRAEIEKERQEIENLWSESVIGHDFESYLSGLGAKNLVKIIDVLDIYFPEEAKEYSTSATLL